MMKKYILLFGMILLLAGYGISCMAAEAPQWSVGAWWVVETQSYNPGGIKAGTENIGWQEKQAWRFEVSDTETINDAAYYVVLIRPVDGNPCPYIFRFWYRATDLFVGRYEVLYPETTDGVLTEATKTVRKDLVGNPSAPFAIPYFPNLPANISPLFLNTDTGSAIMSTATAGVPVQHVESITSMSAASVPNQRISSSLTAEASTRLITIQQGVTVNKQYWNPQLPWSYYSESEGGSSLARRSWLVDYGN